MFFFVYELVTPISHPLHVHSYFQNVVRVSRHFKTLEDQMMAFTDYQMRFLLVYLSMLRDFHHSVETRFLGYLLSYYIPAQLQLFNLQAHGQASFQGSTGKLSRKTPSDSCRFSLISIKFDMFRKNKNIIFLQRNIWNKLKKNFILGHACLIQKLSLFLGFC